MMNNNVMKNNLVRGYSITFLGAFLAVLIFSGCTNKDGVSVPDSYNDQGRELIYAPERVEGEDCSGSFAGFGSSPDFQKAIDDAIEKGQEKFGEDYVVLADIIAWYETTDYLVYSSYCAKVSGYPARFDDETLYTTQDEAPTMFDGHPVYYHSSTGIENDFSKLKYIIKIIPEDKIEFIGAIK